jgi:hypothetical protein
MILISESYDMRRAAGKHILRIFFSIRPEPNKKEDKMNRKERIDRKECVRGGLL